MRKATQFHVYKTSYFDSSHMFLLVQRVIYENLTNFALLLGRTILRLFLIVSMETIFVNLKYKSLYHFSLQICCCSNDMY